MADVFISYRNTPERRAFVKRLAAILRAHEVSVWWDYGLEAGESYRAQITTELGKARIVAPLWCGESISSKWVLMEAELGKDKLVPARLQNIVPPADFEAIQSANLIGWDGSVRHALLAAYVRTICARLGKSTEAEADTLEELSHLPPLTPLPAAHLAPAGTDSGPTTHTHVELHDAWKSFSFKSDSAAVEKFLARAEKAGAHGLAVEIETHLDRLKAEAARSAEKAKAEAERFRPGREFRDGDGPLMVVIPPGEFLMGSPPGEKEMLDDEGPQHKVQFAKPFAVSKFPITVGEWKAFIAATGHSMGDSAFVWNGKEWKDTKGRGWANTGFAQDDRHPAVCVNWHDATAYAAWMAKKTGQSYRLLSEAEWEYACRAGTQTPFHFGRTITPDQANYNGNFTYDGGPKGAYKKGTTSAGTYPANTFGLHDCHGNVWEWVQDHYTDSYTNAPNDGSPVELPNGSYRVLRGGSWYNAPQSLRSANRVRSVPTNRNSGYGFRLARTF